MMYALPCNVQFHTETHLSTGSNNPTGISSLNLQPSQLLPCEMIIPVDCVKMLESIGEGEKMIVTACSLALYPRDARVQGCMLMLSGSCFIIIPPKLHYCIKYVSCTGQFGIVYKAHFKRYESAETEVVAVKTLKGVYLHSIYSMYVISIKSMSTLNSCH